MKIRAFILTSVVALVLGLAFAATVTQRASAACYDTTTKAIIPCPKEKVKKPTATDVPPTRTPTDLPATATLAATSTPAAVPSQTPVAAVVPPAPAGSAVSAACRTSPLGGLLTGLGLLAAGVILRVAPGSTGGPDDGFAYPDSPTQGRVIDTAFDKRRDQPNDRLTPNTDPSPGSGGNMGRLTRAQDLFRVSRLARLVSLPGMGVGAVLAAVAGAQYGGVLSCASLLAPVGGGGIAATGIGLGLALAAVLTAAILATLMRDSVKYTLFLPEGTPTRTTVHVAMKHSSAGTSKTGSDSSSDGDPFRKDS